MFATVAASTSYAATLWYDGSVSRFWDHGDAWSENSLPVETDNIALNSSGISLPNMLSITSGVYATGYTLKLGSDETSNYANDGRIIGLKIEDGGMLHTTANWFEALSIGDNANGYGVLTLESGGILSNQFITAGTRGIGVVTNAGGRINVNTPNGVNGVFRIGLTSSATGLVVMTGGTIEHYSDSSGWNMARIDVGSGGYGVFELSGGIVSNRVCVGSSRDEEYGVGTGVLKMSGGVIDNRLFIGDRDPAANDGYVGTGFAEITGGSVNGHVNVGLYGNGTLVLDGGAINIPRTKQYDPMHINGYGGEVGAGMYVGRHAGSEGKFLMKSGTLEFSDQANLVVGYRGSGFAEFSSDATIPYLRVGGSSAGGYVSVCNGTVLTISQTMQIGGYPLLEAASGDPEICIGSGMAVLSNATLRLTGVDGTGNFDNKSGQLSIGRYAGSYGILRGCGTVQGSGPQSNNVRVWMDEGKIIADGFGEEAALDLNSVISIRNNTSEIAADTTNGWYAVNKGAALFPRAWFNSTENATVLGGWNGDTEPGFVNSVGVAVSGVNGSNRYLRGGLFAGDRSDVHADLMPRNDGVMGIWKIGLTGEVNGSGTLGYVSADLTFRYDQSKVNIGEPIALYRWNGYRWERIAEKIADSTFKISVSDLARPASYDGIYNIGTFALIKKDLKGLVITVL